MEHIIQGLISDLALILVLGAITTVLFKKLKQPVVLGYIVAGFIASPHFELLPSVSRGDNIEFWAQIGIIVLLFSLGLEFSFKKLVNVGASAFISAAIIVMGMMGMGALVGKLILGYGLIDSLFLGGMVSMSSTTIIIKALTDLNLKQRRFVPMIFAVLVVEDLFAVVLMVVLSSVAVNKTVEGGQMLESVLKLSFFLIIWFIVGIFMIPSVFKKYKRLISDEMMLIISMGLCFLMAVFSVRSGFSLALGAFVMGSILAGTVEARRIERLVSPIKDLFGAVFFISVGMMVDPLIIYEHATTIALLATVVIVGMIIFGTIGMLATGQPLRNAVQSGFTLTQIGEFSFIIASMGMGLGVLKPSTYPIIVAVSVITTFTTPFFIKRADWANDLLERLLPNKWIKALNGYSKSAKRAEVPESREIWNNVTKRYFLRLMLYSVVTFAIIVASNIYMWPIIENSVHEAWDELMWVIITFLVISPFLYGIMTPAIKKFERERLISLSGKVSYVPFVVMEIFSIFVSTIFIMILLKGVYSSEIALIASVVISLVIILLFTPLFKKRMARLEKRFVGNANDRENRRTGRGNNLVSDMHLAYMVVGHGCKFAGETLQETDLRRHHGVNIVNIERNGYLHMVPSGSMRIYPGDTLGVIGTEKQIEKLLPLIEAEETQSPGNMGEARFTSAVLTQKSPLLGISLRNARLREDHKAMLVSVERTNEDGTTKHLSPSPDLVFEPGDTLWLVCDKNTIKKII